MTAGNCTDACGTRCDDCRVPLTDDNAGPSCGAHDVCVECLPWLTCRGCKQVWLEMEADRRLDDDAQYEREVSA